MVRSGKLKFRDTGNDHLYIHNFSNLSANRTITWPLLTADDEPLFKTFAATPVNKTIDIKDNTLALRGWTVLLMKVGTTYYAIKYDGTVISSSTTAETVIAAAIANKGVLYFAHTGADSGLTNWNLSAGFTGFTITDNTTITSDYNAVFINVPNGFTGVAFKIGGAGADPDDGVHINNISIAEAGSPSKLWTAIKIEIVTGANSSFGNYRNITIYDANVAVELETAGTGFITNDIFSDMIIYNSNTGFLFDNLGDQISENIFQNIGIETNGAASWGFKNITGTANTFINCRVWDIGAAGTEANILSSSSGTIIIGGRMVGGAGHFIDDGVKTLIVDSGNIVTTRLLPTPDLQKTGTWSGTATTLGNGILTSRLQAIAVGTGANSDGSDSTGIYRTFDTAGTINSLSGIRTDNAMMRRILNCYFKTAIYLNSVTNVRVFAGFVADSTAPTSTSDPLNAKEGVALWLDSAVSANWKRYHNDSSGAGTVDDTTIAALTSTLYPIEIYAVGDSKFRIVALGTSTDISTNIPASTTGLAFWIYIENTTGASRTFRSYYAIVKNDK